MPNLKDQNHTVVTIFDIDDVLAKALDSKADYYPDLDNYYVQDNMEALQPIADLCATARNLIDGGQPVYFITGRHERLFDTTHRWLRVNVNTSIVTAQLFCRPEAMDYTQIAIYKALVVTTLAKITGAKLITFQK